MPDNAPDEDSVTSNPVEQPVLAPTQTTAPQPINGRKSGLSHTKGRYKRRIVKIAMIIAAAIVGSGLAAWLWYSVQLTPLTGEKQQLVAVTIESGSTPSQIGRLLQDKEIIHNATAFDLYTRLSGTRGKLQAGTYRLSPNDSVSQIVEHLVSGAVDQLSITFLPGATLKQHRQVLLDAGFSQFEVDAALSQTYDSPLFEGRPEAADLEGYIYGETYHFNAGASVQQILERTFQEFYAALNKHNLIDTIKQHELTLYQGITLASVIQREVSKSDDQKQVAQVFYTRLDMGMKLESDVTYQYAADKEGVPRDINLDSPYNTRRYFGLPFGPIASPGLGALQAVAAPAAGDYLYFLSGDDDVTYFARTYDQHEANIRDHCALKCSTL